MKLLFCIVLGAVAVLTVSSQQLAGCFLSMGDWGYHNPNVLSMSNYMQDVILHPTSYGCSNVSVTLALGDNFYNGGVSSTTDPQWTATFVNQFRQFPAFRKMPILVTMGDHDYDQLNPSQAPNFTRAQAQIDYGKTVDPFWILPEPNYTMTYTFSGNIKIKFVMINTEALYACLHLQPQWCFQPDHADWIESVLTAADEDESLSGIVIAGHHAVVCPLGGHYDPKLDAILVPIARRHRVSLILTGHSHFVAWSAEMDLSTGPYNNGSMWYIINGAGRGAAAYQCTWSGLVMPVAKPTNKLCFPYSMNQDGAFLIHKVHSSGIEHCVVDSLNGTVVKCQQTTFRRKGAPAPSTAAPPHGSCGACSQSQCTAMMCPATAPFMCTSGPASQGCSQTPWQIGPACSACCDFQLCP